MQRKFESRVGSCKMVSPQSAARLVASVPSPITRQSGQMGYRASIRPM